MKADLHIHTTASDGTLLPSQVVKKACEIGLKAIAIADHDTVDGVCEALEAAKKDNIRVIPAIELSCDYNDMEVHLLGYFINIRDPRLLNTLGFLKEERSKRAGKILDKLSKLGIHISLDKVKNISENASVGRPHIARALVNSGYVYNVQQAFESLLGKNCPGYVAREKLKLEEAVQLVKKIGGVPVLAHPGLLPGLDVLGSIIEKGVMGLEVYYPAHDSDLIKELIKICVQKNLIVTGGSDYHGDYRGALIGQCGVDVEVVDRLKELTENTPYKNF